MTISKGRRCVARRKKSYDLLGALSLQCTISSSEICNGGDFRAIVYLIHADLIAPRTSPKCGDARPPPPFRLLVQPHPHADQAVQGGVGVDESVQRLIAFAVALGLPGADGAALLEAGDDAFGGQLAEIVGVEAAGEVDGAGAGFGQFQASIPGSVLGENHQPSDTQRFPDAAFSTPPVLAPPVLSIAGIVVCALPQPKYITFPNG
ncbi:hypothetical protein [Pseudotabrizicola alkalilacus]|uniref:hypothetical protein n=1 Tax=Pseudotabrizicola alkalilacus TaxID=2305252 RepID=UPI003F491CC8